MAKRVTQRVAVVVNIIILPLGKSYNSFAVGGSAGPAEMEDDLDAFLIDWPAIAMRGPYPALEHNCFDSFNSDVGDIHGLL